MATGGQTSGDGQSGGQGGGFINALASIYPSIKTTLQENEARAMQLGQQKAEGSLLSGIAGGYDPQTGINWSGPSADPSKNPFAVGGSVSRETGADATGSANGMVSSMMQDPLGATVMRLDPKGTLSSIVQRAFAPPQSYQVTAADGTVKNQMLTMAQAMKLQQEGNQLAYADKAKPPDPNQAPTRYDLPGPNNQQQSYMWRPGMGSPQAVGAPGKFTNEPLSDIGKLAFDASHNFNGNSQSPSFGGGTNLGGGSGAPNIQPPIASPNISSGGSGVMNQPGGMPTAANSPASERDPARRPWLQQPPIGAGQNQPQAGTNPFAGIMQAALMKPILENQKLQGEVAAQTAKTAFNAIPENLTGEDAYQWAEDNLPQGREVAAMARRVASGYQKPPPIGRPGSVGEQVQALVDRAEGPGANIGQRFTTNHEYSQSGPTGKAFTAIDTVMRHTDKMLQSFDQMHNRQSPAWNAVANTIEATLGGVRAPVTFNTERDAVASEARKVFAGASGGGITELNEWKDNLSRNASPEQMRGSAESLISLMKGRLDPLIWKYNETMGTNKTIENFMSPDSVKIWQKLQNVAEGGNGAGTPSYTPQALVDELRRRGAVK